MIKRQTQTPTKRTIFYHPLVVGIIMLVVVTICISLLKRIISTQQKQKILHEKQLQLELIDQKNTQLQKDIEDRQSAFYQEQVIRNELNMKKEGETIIQLPDK